VAGAGAATAVAKWATDILKRSWPTAPGWAYVVSALVFATIGYTALLMVQLAPGAALTFDQRTIAEVFLGAGAATVGAVGMTETGKSAQEARTMAVGPEPPA
jgi:hypothetical protein